MNMYEKGVKYCVRWVFLIAAYILVLYDQKNDFTMMQSFSINMASGACVYMFAVLWRTDNLDL